MKTYNPFYLMTITAVTIIGLSCGTDNNETFDQDGGNLDSGIDADVDGDADSDNDADSDTDADSGMDADTDNLYNWHTFYGSSNIDSATMMAVQRNGDLYIIGESDTSWSGPNNEEPLHGHSGSDNIFILKLNPHGAYDWHTFYGLTSNNTATSIVVEEDGGVCITGHSSATWNGPSGQNPLQGHSGNEDVFILKINTDGVYQWHAFYGSNDRDTGNSIATDGNGNIYITGESHTMWDGPDGQNPLRAHSGDEDVFVLKLNSAGDYQWHTFYGPSKSGDSLVMDETGNLYVTGGSSLPWDGPDGETPLHAHSGDYDIFVLKIGHEGEYQWHTFLGSEDDLDRGNALAIDSNGSLYVTGESGLLWDGPNGESPLFTAGDIFILKLNSNGIYQWHSFYGSGDSRADSLATDENGNVFVSGYSYTPWQGPESASPIHAHLGNEDIFILKLDASGDYKWHSFYGSTKSDFSHSMVGGMNNDLYLAGTSTSSWQGPDGQSPLHAYSGNGFSDAFVLKLSD